MNLKRNQLFLLTIITGLLLSLAWRTWGSGLVLLIAFIPLLAVEDHLCNKKQNNKSVVFFLYSYIAFLIWNAVSTWWIWYASPFGASAAIILNALFMAAIFWLFHITKRKLGQRFGYFAFVFYWIGFEYFHLDWELSWSWLTLGNAFGNDILFIQWYEFTGHLGGSLWVLVVNALLFLIIKAYINGDTAKNQKTKRLILAAIIFVPIIVSLIIFFTYKEEENPYNIVVVQPNIDPYNEKFGGMTQQDQLDIMLNLAKTKADENTDYVVCPETAIATIVEEDVPNNNYVRQISDFIANYPKMNFVTGITSMEYHIDGQPVREGARKFPNTPDGKEHYYYVYNAAMQVDRSDSVQIYHKSKLVLGVEKMPFQKFLSSLGDIAIDLGGTTGTLGIQPDREVFVNFGNTNKIAPVICYESIFGEYVAEYVNNGANMIFVVTNDGWWKDTPGYLQHLSYARLRAIETRRSVARSANTGISCFINQRGEIFQATKWWERDVIKGTINASDKKTFYVQMGDYLGRGALFFALLILLYTISYSLINRKKNINKVNAE
ncbi:MAG: apolipoprotein N-acyltransferase [Bacteroidales bacterium]|nr:apolipoprotein N-acyltransferase [Bacteroidales bacterium]